MDASEIWRQVMEITPAPRTYEGTYVLLLGWAVDYDDTGTALEFMALSKVLEESYGCVVRFQRLHTEDHPQILVTRYIADFVYDYHQLDRLLVVCYGGHGRVPLGSNDSLILSGLATAEHDVRRERDINWVQVETNLGFARADVLVVLNCCQAGVLRGPLFSGNERKKFQYIAACSATGSTPCAGNSSFASVMIWALRTLSREPGFTTNQLADTLRAHRHFPRDQQPLVFSRKFGPRLEDIWIAPTTAEEGPGNILRQTQRQHEPTAAILDLRFHFAEHATSRDIESMAMNVRSSLEHEPLNFPFHKVSFRRYTLNVPGDDVVDELEPGDLGIDEGFLVERGMPALPGNAVEDQSSELLHLISRTLGLVFQGYGPVPARPGTSFV